MIGEIIGATGALTALALAVLIFGFAPGIALAAIVRLIPDIDRRRELQSELYEVPRWERPFWVAEQLEVAVRIGLTPRLEWYWGRHVWHRAKLESGLERHLQYPESFEVPDGEAKSDVRPGDLVKLMWSVDKFPGERMWVKVTERRGDLLVGTLENWPIYVYLHPGERVPFHIDDIIDCQFDDT
ncbi:hypothetical protein, partial [Cellulomonas hominis]